MDTKDSDSLLEDSASCMSFELDEPNLSNTANNSSVLGSSTESTDNEMQLDSRKTKKIKTSEEKPIKLEHQELDDMALDFIKEAGFDSPEDFEGLGINFKDLAEQQRIEESIHHDTSKDFYVAQEMQKSLNETVPNPQPSSNPPIAPFFKPKPKSEVKMEPDYLELSSKLSSEGSPDKLDNKNFDYNFIKKDPDTSSLMTQESVEDSDDETDDGIPPSSYVPPVKTETDLEQPNSLPSTDTATLASSSTSSSTSSSSAYLPTMPNSFGFPTAYPDYINDHINDHELRELLQNIEYDDPPPPENRTGTPQGLVCNLLEHQKIGLDWMKKMESTNNRGGILADDMGLGKTIQALSIILTRPCEQDTLDIIPRRIPKSKANQEFKIKATLIVCPVSLIDQWRREIESKTDPMLKVLVFYGSNRVKDLHEFSDYDVIITSFGVLTKNYNREQCSGPLHKLIFHRFIIDEAHIIKNTATRMAYACCAVQATYRWCMTATPIQNKIEELYSLIKFLRIRPFCDWTEFRTSISSLINKGGHNKYRRGIRAAHLLLKATCLRRSKKSMIDGHPILNLPERNVHMTHIEFSKDERSFYNALNARIQASFNAYVKAGSVMKNYSSVLALLLRLRQACLHPELTLTEGQGESESDREKAAAEEEIARKMKSKIVDRLLDSEDDVTEVECPVCLDIAQNARILPGCGHVLCKECLDGMENSEETTSRKCPKCRSSIDHKETITIKSFFKIHAPDLYKEIEKEEEEEEEKDVVLEFEEFLSSAKIDKMMDILNKTKKETNGEDKTIVFSQFTSFLDLIEGPLKKSEHRFLRYDGTMSILQRADTVNDFFEDPNITVLLVSTRCGSLGLNLTVANRVILMDVWWNPALENQAIDRVHRIGQGKSVEVHRIFINNSVEDRILVLQQKKQDLSDSVLGEGSKKMTSRLGLNEMMYLFRGGEPPADT